MFLNNVNELRIGQKIQYIGETLDLFGTIMTVESINVEKQQCKVVSGDRYLRYCDVKNVLVINEAELISLNYAIEQYRIRGNCRPYIINPCIINDMGVLV
jgi:hypothetical protein